MFFIQSELAGRLLNEQGTGDRTSQNINNGPKGIFGEKMRDIHSNLRLAKLEQLLKYGFRNREIWLKIIRSELDLLKYMQEHGRLTVQEARRMTELESRAMSLP